MNFILLMMLYLITYYLRYIPFTVTYPNILRIKYKTKNYRGVIRVVIHITGDFHTASTITTAGLYESHLEKRGILKLYRLLNDVA